MIETVILDWSGVVSDDLEATFATSNDVLEHWGHSRLTMQKFRELYELPWMRFYEKLGMQVNMEKEYELWEKIFPKHFGKIKSFPCSKKVLQWLKQNGKKVMVFSSHCQKLVEQEIEDYGFQGLIDHVDASNEDKREKIDALLKRHEIETKTTIYVGDMVHDVETAKQAGIRSVAVLCGYDSKEKLEKAGPGFIIKDLGELPGLVEKIEGAADE